MFDWQAWQLFFMQFHFIRPWWLMSFIPFGVILLLRWRYEAKPEWADVLPEHLRHALTIGEHGWKKQLPLKLLSLCIALGIVVCAGPTWQRQASPFGEDKAQMIVVLDNSDSMLERDLAPSRLERAKQKIRDLLALRSGGKTGLVVYAGSAHIAMPLTQDQAVFAPFLSAISPDIMPQAGKSAVQALPLVDELLRGSLGGTVLLVTDGIQSKDIDVFRDFFHDKPYQLLILATGNPEVVAKNPMNLDGLEQLADQASGKLVLVSVDDDDIQTLNRAIERHMQINGESAMPWKDMSHPLIMVIAILTLFWFRKGWLVQWCVVGLLFAGMLPTPSYAAVYSSAETQPVEQIETWDKVSQWWMDLWLTPDQQGQRLFYKLHYLEAAKHYQDPLNKGIAYYYAGEYKLAQMEFVEADSDLGWYYAASALAQQREYVAARNLLRQLAQKTDIEPSLLSDIQHNLQVISALVEEINRVSQSQIGTPDGPDSSQELGEQPQTGDGVNEQTAETFMQKETLNAAQILGSDELADKWLRKVEADPKFFLSRKFRLQLQQHNQPSQHSTRSTKEAD